MEPTKKHQCDEVLINSTQKHKIQKNSCKEIFDSCWCNTFWCESAFGFKHQVLNYYLYY